MVKKKDTTEERIVAVEEALSKTEQFIERNQKIITYVIGGLIVIVLLVFGFRKFVTQPKEKAGQKALFAAEYYFEQDSLDLALNGFGESIGFLGVIDDYGSTSAGNLAKYYAGICYLNLGEYEEAVDYLKKFDGDDLVSPAMALGAIGDAYMQMGEVEEAIGYYDRAAAKNENELSSPVFLLKAGWAYEMIEDHSSALECYEKIKIDFSTSREARDIDKYIARAKAHLGEI